jgi:hypothetical protein
MKTIKIAQVNRYMIIAFLLFSWTSGLYSQQVIKFKNGKVEKVKFVYLHQDTLKYLLNPERYRLWKVMLGEVDCIRASSQYSQLVIKFKTGMEEKVKIVDLHQDTLKYQLRTKPYELRTVRLEEVDCIGIKLKGKNTVWDTNYILKGYLHEKHRTNTGIVLASLGTAITVGGIIIVANPNANDGQKVLGVSIIIIGVALLLPGTIIAIGHSSKMREYKAQLHGFSFDLKYTPEHKGITLVYRF